ncbi:unnamed protein product [Mytilus coruscus]|uniref:Farnesoic acid O-methyl transferase domain-containing protein n=1 Tax=Mytilus coruscus TaxID=42192 RepID=A0A6J8DT80_MYTCO|nr:unnamed protein product [Mytilus coruscus]
MNYTTGINRYNLDLSGITSFGFELKACHDAHVLLSNSDIRNSSNPLYEIIIGYYNYFSLIVYRADAVRDDGSWNFTEIETENILNCNVYLPFWICWADGDVKLGTGFVVGENVVGNLTNTHHFEVRSIHVLTDRDVLGEWDIQVEVYFKINCSMDITKSELVVVDGMKCSEMMCATSCGLSKACMGYNFNNAMNRCKLLSFESNVVTDVPHHIEAGWRFYSKCYNGKTACLGCYF